MILGIKNFLAYSRIAIFKSVYANSSTYFSDFSTPLQLIISFYSKHISFIDYIYIKTGFFSIFSSTSLRENRPNSRTRCSPICHSGYFKGCSIHSPQRPSFTMFSWENSSIWLRLWWVRMECWVSNFSNIC